MIFISVLFSVLAPTKLWSYTDFNKFITEVSNGPNISQCEEQPKENCPELLNQYYSIRKQKWDLNESDEKLHDKLELALYEIGNQCLATLSSRCYPALKESISTKELNKAFEGFKQNSDFRMKEPAVFCYKRAKKLAQYFAEKGYRTEIVHIKSAPTLIAPLLDPKDNYRDKFIDYHGSHYVLSIKGEDGKEYLLDPQFAEKPLSKKDYFISTIGTECIQQASVSNMWGCNYAQHPSAWEAPFGEDFRPANSKFQYDRFGDSIEAVLLGKSSKGACGYIEPSPNYFNPLNKPEVLQKDNRITDKRRGEIIIASLHKLYLERMKYLDEPSFEGHLKKDLKKYKKELESYDSHIASACQKMDLSNKSCKEIQRNFEKYLKQIDQN